jgi:proton-dependent oligopeptide transporter, POT family
MSSTFHPKGLYILFVTEMWERFSYYGMRAIFVLFLTKALLLDKAAASSIYSNYTGLVYLTPLIGAYMADRYWGNRKSIEVGGVLMALGQLLMFLAGYFYANVDLARIIMMGGLTLLIVGNGFFKPNISTMVGQLYAKDDKRVDAAFTIFYMGINLGAFFSPLICGGLGDTGNPADFKWGFLAACVGMVLSTSLFVWLKNHYLVTPEGEPVGSIPNRNRAQAVSGSEVKSEFTRGQIITWVVIEILLFGVLYYFDQGVIGSFIFSLSVAAPGFILSDRSLTKVEKERIWVIFIVAFFVIFFWASFEQAGASLTFFAEEQTNREVGWHLSKLVFGTLLFVIIGVLSYFGVKVFRQLNNEQKGVKEVILILLGSAIAYLVYVAICFPEQGRTIDAIPASFFQSINAIAIVLFAPLFSILWTFLGKRRLEPSSPFKQAFGLLLLAIGYFIIALGVKGVDASTKVSMMWLVSLYLVHTFGELCLSPIGLSMVNKLAPVKFASLLMGVWFLSTAAANKFAGTLSGFYPETMVTVSAVEEQQLRLQTVKLCSTTANAELIHGEKFLSIDQISLAGITDKSQKEEVLKAIFDKSIVKEKSFLGYSIKNLYDFFMLFVIMAGIASVFLFLLAKRLAKMMG